MISGSLSNFHRGPVVGPNPESKEMSKETVADVAQSVFEAEVKAFRSRLALGNICGDCMFYQDELENKQKLLEALSLKDCFCHLRKRKIEYTHLFQTIDQQIKNEKATDSDLAAIFEPFTFLKGCFSDLAEMSRDLAKASSTVQIKSVIENHGIIFDKKMKKYCVAQGVSLPHFLTDQKTIESVAKASLDCSLKKCFELITAMEMRIADPLPSQLMPFLQDLHRQHSGLVLRVNTSDIAKDFEIFRNEISVLEESCLYLKEVGEQMLKARTTPNDPATQFRTRLTLVALNTLYPGRVDLNNF